MELSKEKLKQLVSLINSIKDIKLYQDKLEEEYLDEIIEKLVEIDNTNNRLIIHFLMNKGMENIFLEEDKLIFSFGRVTNLYVGYKPEPINYLLLGSVQNPSLDNQYLYIDILESFNYEKISNEIKDRYNMYDEYKNGSIITYYSPEYDLIGFNVYCDITLGILFYDLDKMDFIEFDEKTEWIKVMVEKV